MTYTATISRNFRDTHTTTPKVLLRNIIDESGNLFRDHAWVEITDYLTKVIPSTDTSSTITFTARTKEYCTIGPVKQTLVRLRNIKELLCSSI